MKTNRILEACVENFHQAMLAEQQGANRIELCENLAVGGTTPSWGTIHHCSQQLHLPVMVMLRPRSGNFVYSAAELDILHNDLAVCRELKVAGVVVGFLTSDHQIDFELTAAFVKAAAPLEVTFHKAIDEIADPIAAIPLLEAIGVRRVLSSGKAPTAWEGRYLLQQMANTAQELILVAAGKITWENIAMHQDNLDIHEFHGKKIVGDLTKSL